jgi:uncharacterized membrane protein
LRKQKRQFYGEHVDRKFRVVNIVFTVMVLFMFASVLYDSFVHDLPYYYILFAFGGLILGRIFQLTRNIRVREEDSTITQESGIISAIFLIVVLIFKNFLGEQVFQDLNVVYFSDALYLFFIGFYFERIYNSSKQVDEIAYRFIGKKDEEK